MELAYAMIVGMVMLFAVILLFPSFNLIMNNYIFPLMDTYAPGSGTLLKTIWNVWPLLFIGVLVIMIIAASMRRENEQFYYR